MPQIGKGGVARHEAVLGADTFHLDGESRERQNLLRFAELLDQAIKVALAQEELVVVAVCAGAPKCGSAHEDFVLDRGVKIGLAHRSNISHRSRFASRHAAVFTLTQPRVRARPVGLIALLRHDALEPEFERGRQQLLRIIEGLREAQQIPVGAGEQTLKARAALLQRLAPHILAADRSEIEAPGAAAVGVARRQAAEVGDAVGIAADELGVDDARRQAEQRLADHGEAPGDVLARFGSG